MALLELLLRKDNRAYISFYNALVKEAYDDLANLLHDDLPRMLPDAHKSSSDDCTPYGEKRKNVFAVVVRHVGFTKVSSPPLSSGLLILFF